MKYKISHITIYDYADFASLTHNELFLTPRNTPEQKVLESTITLAPAPSVFFRHEDFFGNSVIATTVDKPHKNLQTTALSQVFLNPTPDMVANLSRKKACRSHRSMGFFLFVIECLDRGGVGCYDG